MAQLRQGYEAIVERDGEVIVVGPEDAAAFRRTFEKEALPFVGLPDPNHRVLDLFGQELKILKLGRLPAQVVVDREGVVRFAHYGHDMADIPKLEEVLAILDELRA